MNRREPKNVRILAKGKKHSTFCCFIQTEAFYLQHSMNLCSELINYVSKRSECKYVRWWENERKQNKWKNCIAHVRRQLKLEIACSRFAHDQSLVSRFMTTNKTNIKCGFNHHSWPIERMQNIKFVCGWYCWEAYKSSPSNRLHVWNRNVLKLKIYSHQTTKL